MQLSCFLFRIFADLSHNQLAFISSDAFFYQHNLTTLDVSYNNLSNLMPVTVSTLYNLHTLNISGNVLIDLFNMRHTFDVSKIPIISYVLTYEVVADEYNFEQ